MTGSDSWLAAASQNTSNGAIMEPFVVAFALIGLAMAVLIVPTWSAARSSPGTSGSAC